MAWFWNKKEQEKPRTLTQISLEEREQVEALLSDGVSASEVANEFNLAPASVIQLKRQVVNPRVPRNQEIARLREEASIIREQANLEKLKEDLAFERERRELELEIKRLELEEKRRDLADENELTYEDLADEPDKALWGFLSQLLTKNGQPLPANPVYVEPAPAPTEQKTIDWGREMPDELIALEIENYTDAQIRTAQGWSDENLSKLIKGQKPTIHPNNLKKIIAQIRAYGN